MGALIISPTRELAQQTLEVLKPLAQVNNLSVGSLMGGTKNIASKLRQLNSVGKINA